MEEQGTGKYTQAEVSRSKDKSWKDCLPCQM